MSDVMIEKLGFFSDGRGVVFEPMDADQLPLQHNCHVVVTEPGAVRGNHFHEQGTEILTVVGPAIVRMRENGCIRDVNVESGSVIRFKFPPRVSHAFKNTGARPMLAIAFNTQLYDPAHPDVFRDALIE
jgi:dTDP-4-dehydrorhamnose 3,5-epimerase-like enzyme